MRHIAAVLAGAVVGLSACAAEPSPTPASSATPTATPSATVTPSPDVSVSPAASPTATPEPPLSIPLPETTDDRVVVVEVQPSIGPDGGELLVTVTSRADVRIDELVLRWPTELNEQLFLAPFVPSQERIREGGPPLVQPWTKWVVGPGEQGEPEGTTSLGYGPLLPGATLSIELDATRTTAEPLAFDLQVLAGNDLLTLEGGEPAELRVEIP